MTRRLIPALQNFLGGIRHVCALVVLALEVDQVAHAIEGHDGDELDFAFEFASPELDTAVAGDLFRFDGGEYLVIKQLLVGRGILWRGPAVPETFDAHRLPPFFLSST